MFKTPESRGLANQNALALADNRPYYTLCDSLCCARPPASLNFELKWASVQMDLYAETALNGWSATSERCGRNFCQPAARTECSHEP